MKAIKSLIFTAIVLAAPLALTHQAMAVTVDGCALAGQETKQDLCPPTGLLLYYGPRGFDLLSFTLASALSVECEGAELTGEFVESGKGESAHGEFSEFSAAECSSSCGTASVAGFNLPWRFEATSVESEVIEGIGLEYTTCGLTCKYESAEVATKVSGGETATASITKAVLKKVSGGLSCPSTVSWSSLSDLLPEHFTYVLLI